MPTAATTATTAAGIHHSHVHSNANGSNAPARAASNATETKRINAPASRERVFVAKRSDIAALARGRTGQSQVSWVVVVRNASKSSRHCAGVVLSGSMPV
jgi:hypothetical protein